MMINNKLFVVTVSMAMLMVFFNTGINAIICVNDIVPVFEDPDGQKKQEIETYVISGASSFLRAQSYAYLLLDEYELSGLSSFNFTKALDYTGNAITLLENARVQYISAKSLGEGLGYNPEKIDRFKFFDYKGFIEENQLNEDIAMKVRGYLSKGDILGIYQQAANDIADILNTLYVIRESLKMNEKPDIHLFWKLLQQYSESSLFGNYATLMGTTVLGVPVD